MRSAGLAPVGGRDGGRRGVSLFALELLPRITRAQSMDVLSSQATVAGYRAVLLAAAALPKMFPMMITAAGTLNAAKVFVIGAGVAGLQAIATARRLGAAVSAYDVRPAVKEQVQSLGAKFVEMPLETAAAETKGGYAQQMDEEFYRRQRELMARVVAESDVVITTAAVPGKKSPVLVTAEMVAEMAPGSVIVDLAAERGGNCELTRADQTVVEQRRDDPRPDQLPAEVPAARQPDVRQEHRHFPAEPGQGQAGADQPGRRDYPRHADRPRRRRWSIRASSSCSARRRPESIGRHALRDTCPTKKGPVERCRPMLSRCWQPPRARQPRRSGLSDPVVRADAGHVHRACW